MHTHALLLNADFQPLKVIHWHRAIELILDARADLVEDYAGRAVRSASLSFPWPAVLRLRKFVKPRVRLKFNRQNVLARDRYECAYCGASPRVASRPDLTQLTIEHVVPRAQSVRAKVRSIVDPGKIIPVTCWENVVTACQGCNLRKRDRTPQQAGMILRYQPRIPDAWDVLRASLRRVRIPDEWVAYLPEAAAEWSGYWTVELDED